MSRFIMGTVVDCCVVCNGSVPNHVMFSHRTVQAHAQRHIQADIQRDRHGH